ncbi:MAG: beta-ketoacyl-[acyl-carrier-protein] synthase II [Verrucomicrobia bacterium 21-51-4]|nr:MAG: beta-ketoacyl-[acyl-carrier-protein] synthase II [Verrucomicrobia bacterium 21-51-4]HQU08670.1 beta-ketoacyl-ACP synthase II [Opitutales bacterium]
MRPALPNHTVVVTGLGVITSLGQDAQSFFDNLVAGKSGIARIDRFWETELSSKIGAEVKDFNAEAIMDPKEAKRSDRYTHFAMAAAKGAVADAKLDVTKVDKNRMGVMIGSGIGGMDTFERQSRVFFERGPRKVSPFMIPSLIPNMASGLVAIEMGARGPNFAIVSACATGSHAIGEAYRSIRLGEADIMLAGGSEAAVTVLGYSGFCAMRAMCTSFNDEPERASRPFDAKRDGFIMGEGAGVIVLESLEHAKARGAHIYCELAGYAASCDAFHITSPDPDGEGLYQCLTRALKDADVTAQQVDYINAHGTSTPYNDKFETIAFKRVLGDHARNVPISSTKSMTGHLLGAAGGIEAAVCVKAIQNGVVPPTINQEFPDPDCDLDYVPNKARKASVKVAVSDNLGFGGQNVALVFKAL